MEGRHYLLPPEARLGRTVELVEQGGYFVIHAPRQCGKTTSFQALAERLTREGNYTALWVTCESGAAAGEDAERGVAVVVAAIAELARSLPPELRPPPVSELESADPLNLLWFYLSRWAASSPRPVVLFLDEIDALVGRSLIAVLRQIRALFSAKGHAHPHSIALIGLRDVRDYRLADGAEGPRLGTSSPFNIKVESLTLRNFTASEVKELCLQHQQATGQPFTAAALARIFELTWGQPWLVNALARQLVEVEVPDRAVAIDLPAVELAKERLILRRDTHLDSLAERLREPRLRRVIAPILEGGFFGSEVTEDDLDYAVDLGLLRREDGNLVIANPIYREVIPRSLAAVLEASVTLSRPQFVAADGSLRVDTLIAGFREFWAEHAESFLAKAPYSEAAAHLVFMAFLHKVVNGGGFIDREYAVGSGRIDLLLRWPFRGGLQRVAFELKVRRGPANPRRKGIAQLAAYLERLGLEEGILLIFDLRPEGPPQAQRFRREQALHQGRRLTVLVL